MNYKIITISLLSLLTHYTCSPTNFQLYNSLPCTLYYALSSKTSKSTAHTFIPLEPYSTVNTEIETTQSIELIVVKELPNADQEIPLYRIIPSSESFTIDIKTYQTKKGDIRIIPLTNSIAQEPTEGQLPLAKTISHHNIWITKTTYHPAQIVQKVVPPQTSAANETSEQIPTSQILTSGETPKEPVPQVSLLESAITNTPDSSPEKENPVLDQIKSPTIQEASY